MATVRRFDISHHRPSTPDCQICGALKIEETTDQPLNRTSVSFATSPQCPAAEPSRGDFYLPGKCGLSLVTSAILARPALRNAATNAPQTRQTHWTSSNEPGVQLSRRGASKRPQLVMVAGVACALFPSSTGSQAAQPSPESLHLEIHTSRRDSRRLTTRARILGGDEKLYPASG